MPTSLDHSYLRPLEDYKYALVLVDGFTRYKWVYFMRTKSEAPEYTRTFISSFNSLISKRFGADEAFTLQRGVYPYR
jgi:hypothetical protein